MGVKGRGHESGRASETRSIIEAIFVKHNLLQRGSTGYSFKKLDKAGKDKKIREQSRIKANSSLTWTRKCTTGKRHPLEAKLAVCFRVCTFNHLAEE